MNTVQKTIVSIVTVIATIVIAWAWAANYTANNRNACDGYEPVPFCFATVWWIWLLCFGVGGVGLYKLWGDKKEEAPPAKKQRFVDDDEVDDELLAKK